MTGIKHSCRVCGETDMPPSYGHCVRCHRTYSNVEAGDWHLPLDGECASDEEHRAWGLWQDHRGYWWGQPNSAGIQKRMTPEKKAQVRKRPRRPSEPLETQGVLLTPGHAERPLDVAADPRNVEG